MARRTASGQRTPVADRGDIYLVSLDPTQGLANGAVNASLLPKRRHGQWLRSLTDPTTGGRLAEMEVILRIPDDLAQRLGSVEHLERRALEALALEEFKLGHLTKPELRHLLGFETRDALDGFLKAHDVFEPYSLDDLQRERQDLGRLGF